MKPGQFDGWVADAVRHFWATREGQQSKQGQAAGVHDAGSRGAVTGGAHVDGFIRLVAKIVADAGVAEASVRHQLRASTYLPGFYRPTKSWDLLVVDAGRLLACIEFKSQVGSFGNNFNNRTEEAIGSATDFWTAYREGAFDGSPSTVARLLHVARGLAELQPAGRRAGASLQGVPRISRCIICQAVRIAMYQAGSRENV